MRGENVIDVDYVNEEIASAIKTQLAEGKYPTANIYGSGDAGVKIAELLAHVDLSIEKRITF